MTLTQFLLARIAEDEAAVLALLDPPASRAAGTPARPTLDTPLARSGDWELTPRRVLAEVAAKRHLVELAYEATGLDMTVDLDRTVNAREDSGVAFVGDRMLRTLALAYAEHPDFDEDWRHPPL
ncbi:DUF6221 family protein [Isoptericola cucumis]|uniref:Uncharacterized protein n=1 Tax=Isoptericola cucumis TaxID=1776856 RepID=A0ABQ2B8V4_9MICO|nr:DUF6221 family protein [Isoptericola cucumis]GGI10755.1 hypothetical protein GCM10007368_32810 [Isoptericola cucumis]